MEINQLIFVSIFSAFVLLTILITVFKIRFNTLIKNKDTEIIENAKYIKELQKRLDEKSTQIKLDDKCNYLTLIDFDNMDIFSIERQDNKTIIGHWINNKYYNQETDEWCIYISIEQHNKLIRDYEKYTTQTTSVMG